MLAGEVALRIVNSKVSPSHHDPLSSKGRSNPGPFTGFALVFATLIAFGANGAMDLTGANASTTAMASSSESRAHSESTAPPANTSSEVFSISTDDQGNGGPLSGNNIQRWEVLFIRGTFSSKETLSLGQNVGCGSSGETSGETCSEVVNGIEYSNLGSPSGTWFSVRAPSNSVAMYSPKSSLNSLAAFRGAAVGPISDIGAAQISGFTTTEYRATVSLVELYKEDQAFPLGFVGLTYLLASPIPFEPPMTTPVTVWTDSRGEILQARTTETVKLTASQSVDGRASTVSQTSTILVSNFNVKFHVTPPPASQVRPMPISSPTVIEGTVTTTSKNGKSPAVSGLLVIQPHGNNVSEAKNSIIEHDSYAWVTRTGSYSGRINVNSGYSAASYDLSATLYESPSKKLTCSAGPNLVFPVGRTTSGVDFFCAS